jgi:hypothetical protein
MLKVNRPARVSDSGGVQRMFAPGRLTLGTCFPIEAFRRTAEASAAGAIREQALQQVERQVTNLVDAIAEGLRAPGLQARLDALGARRAKLQAEALAVVVARPASNRSAAYSPCWARRALADCGKHPPPACSACPQVR